jgi:hypothetical protein
MAPLKQKGDLAELKVATDLVERGWTIAIPYGEDSDVDLIAYRDNDIRRVQVKHTCSDGCVVSVRPQSLSLTNGKVRKVKQYTARTIDWLAVWDRTTDACFYLDASELGNGRRQLHLRLVPTANNQRIGIRFADDYRDPPKGPAPLPTFFPTTNG